MSELIYALSKKELKAFVHIVISEVKKSELKGLDICLTPGDRMSSEETAKFLGICEMTLVNWKKKNLIPFYQIDKKTFFSRKEILAAAKNNSKLIKPSRK